MFVNGGTAVAQAQPEDTYLCIGDIDCVSLEITTPSLDRLNQASRIRLASGTDCFPGHHQCKEKTHRHHVKFTFVTDVGMKWVTVHEPKMILKGFHESSEIRASLPRR